jgi:hypothetical protein
MPARKPSPGPGDLFFKPDKAKTGGRIRKWVERNTQTPAEAKKAAKKRASAVKKGTEGPKQSKPGGYSMGYTPGSSTKKKRRA